MIKVNYAGTLCVVFSDSIEQKLRVRTVLVTAHPLNKICLEINGSYLFR